jgi:formate/nitrite transporter
MASSNSDNHLNYIDAFIPAEMAERAEQIGVKKANLPSGTMFLLAVLAGAFISLGAVFSTTVTAGTAAALPFGVVKLLGGVAFCLGLILVVVAGAELFTGNNLKVMALANGKITLQQLLRSWLVVYAGNFAGSIATAAIMLPSRHYMHGNGAIGLNALTIAAAKCQLAFLQALTLGILCNALVCLAVWLCYSARSTTDKILSIIFPITAFVAAGFEHSVANMYFVPVGLLTSDWADRCHERRSFRPTFYFLSRRRLTLRRTNPRQRPPQVLIRRFLVEIQRRSPTRQIDRLDSSLRPRTARIRPCGTFRFA